MATQENHHSRFNETIAKAYGGRAPYHPELFKELIKRSFGSGQIGKMLDLCAGRGEVLEGFRPWVREITAADASTDMIGARVEDEGVDWISVDVNSEQLFTKLDGHHFNLVTAGRSIQYIDEQTLVEIRSRLMASDSFFVTLQSGLSQQNPWLPLYRKVRQEFFSRGQSRWDGLAREKMKNAGFQHLNDVQLVYRDRWTIERLFSLMSSYSSYGSEVPGKEERLKSALRQELGSHLVEGKLNVAISNTACLFHRSS